MELITVKPEVKKVQYRFIEERLNDFGASLNEMVTDNGNTLFEWRVNRTNDKLCIIEFNDKNYVIFEQK